MIRLIVADDNYYIRSQIHHLLERMKGFQIVADAEDGFEVIRLLEQFRPDMVLLDIEMPGMSGIDVLRYLSDKKFPVDAIIVSAYFDSELIRGAFELGAKGFVIKDEMMDTLPQAIPVIREQRKLFLSDKTRIAVGISG